MSEVLQWKLTQQGFKTQRRHAARLRDFAKGQTELKSLKTELLHCKLEKAQLSYALRQWENWWGQSQWQKPVDTLLEALTVESPSNGAQTGEETTIMEPTGATVWWTCCQGNEPGCVTAKEPTERELIPLELHTRALQELRDELNKAHRTENE